MGQKIVVNEALTKLRNRQFLSELNENIEYIDVIAPNYSFAWVDSCKDIQKLLCELNDTQRAVLLMHEVEGFSHKEIAAFFDKTESFSKVTLSRVFKKLERRAKLLTKGVKLAPFKC